MYLYHSLNLLPAPSPLPPPQSLCLWSIFCLPMNILKVKSFVVFLFCFVFQSNSSLLHSSIVQFLYLFHLLLYSFYVSLPTNQEETHKNALLGKACRKSFFSHFSSNHNKTGGRHRNNLPMFYLDCFFFLFFFSFRC